MALIIERAESTGEGVTEGLTLHVKGFPDSRTMGEYFARSGIKIIPSEPGETNPQWWDLFIGRADAGIAYAPEDGIAKIEIESSAALGMCLPPATIEGRHVYLGGVPDFASARDRLPADYGIEEISANGPVDRMGLLLQGNLQCLSDPLGTATRTVVEGLLVRGEYFVLGSDLHNPQTLDIRLKGLKRAIALVGNEVVDRLTITNPRQLLVG